MNRQSDREWTRPLVVGILVTLAAARTAPAQDFKVILNFGGANGALPVAPLVQGLDGNLYGTTSYGGANSSGTVFRITPSGQATTLYSFCQQTLCADGANPYTGLVQATDGNLYGTTNYGGKHSVGTLFRVAPSGALTTLYSFCARANCADGSFPSSVVQATDGTFYGTTDEGGSNGAGTVFKITAAGTLTTVYNFCSQSDCADGELPHAGLIQASDGNFYGTTYEGGAYGNGSAFRITPAGVLTSLYSFCSDVQCTTGYEPVAALVQGLDGNFYGTTSGGANFYGAVFKITATGTMTALHDFCPQEENCTDGSTPDAALVQAGDGNFYWTTFVGGSDNEGTVFKITPTGALTTLYSFDGTDGSLEMAGVVQETNGTFYGTVEAGGSDRSCPYEGGCGTVFTLNVGLGPFVEMLPASGKVGTVVKILGNSLTGATSVTFDGTVAKFKVVSATEISTAVPQGAATGKVQVTTSGKVLSSNVPFRAIP